MRTADRKRNVAAGLCRDCNAVATEPGSYCFKHYEKLKERQLRRQQKLRSESRCVSCGEPATGQFCEKHRDQRREYMSTYDRVEYVKNYNKANSVKKAEYQREYRRRKKDGEGAGQ